MYCMCVLQDWEVWSQGSLPKAGDEPLVGLLTLDTLLLTRPLPDTWTTTGINVPVVFG